MKHKYEEATDVEIEYLEDWDREDPMPNIIENSFKLPEDLTLEDFLELMEGLHEFANNS